MALDVPVEDAARTPDWLSLFSPRLTLSTTPSAGRGCRTRDGRRGHAGRWVVALRGGVLSRAALLLPFVGPFALDLARVRARQEPDWSILVQLRLSRTLLGLFAGGALALAGALFQAMLRDALATPYTLGISAGASLGAVVAIWLGWQQIAGLPAIWVAALAGAAIVLALVVGAALQQRRVSSFSLLLSGLAANSVCSAFIIVDLRPGRARPSRFRSRAG